MTLDWSDPAAHNRLIERVGHDEYNRLHAEQMARSTVATVNGHAIRKVLEPLRQAVSGRHDGHRIQRIRSGEDFRFQEEGSKRCHWKSSASFSSRMTDGKNTSSGTHKFETD
jgi:hypothetical protein